MKLIIVLLILFIINIANAQFDEENAIYTTTEINVGNYFGFDFNLNYVYDEEYSVRLGYTGNIRKPISEPQNFSSGFLGIFFLGLGRPFDHFDSYEFCVGKIIRLDEKGIYRLNLSAGIGYTTIREPENWEVVYDLYSIGNNYTWEFKKYTLYSIIFNPKLEIPYTNYVGFTVSPMMQINKDRTYYGLGLGLMIGLLRP